MNKQTSKQTNKQRNKRKHQNKRNYLRQKDKKASQKEIKQANQSKVQQFNFSHFFKRQRGLSKVVLTVDATAVPFHLCRAIAATHTDLSTSAFGNPPGGNFAWPNYKSPTEGFP